MEKQDELLTQIRANLETAQSGVADMIETITSLERVLTALIEHIAADDNAGGLLSRRTMMTADNARLFLSRLHAPPPG